MSAMNIHTVAGRQALIAKLEDIDAGLAQLSVYVANLENDNEQLRQAHGEPPELALHRELVDLVWGKAESIYSDRVQELVTQLRAR